MRSKRPRRAPWHAVLIAVSVGGAVAAPWAAYAEDGPMGVERVARIISTYYESRTAQKDDETRWVQVDLGRTLAVDTVKLFPFVDWGPNSAGFPARFRVEVADDPAFANPRLVADYTTTDYPKPADEVAVLKAPGVRGRYVRLTATRLRDHTLRLFKLQVWSAGREVAVGRPIVDSDRGSIGASPLTAPPRPQGDEVVTDNPGNVIPANQWRPVAYRAQKPLTGVTLDDGLFKSVMQNNVEYLLGSFSNDEMLRQFRERAGKPVSTAGLREPHGFWDISLPGSSAGRFMMGAGNTLRWMDNPELRRRMNAMVDAIADCRQADGFIMAYPENAIFFNERAAYTRSWLTHGLIEAGYAGNRTAFDLLRSHYDWFDNCSYRPELLRRGGQGVQGMIANTRVYFTPIGKPEDLQTIQRYFQENYWLDQLARRDPAAIWRYPYDHPHCYLLTSLEPYLDLYRATGAKRYLEAAKGGWELYHNDWEHVGGSIAICEGDSYPPQSNFLHRHTGELCGSVFWAFYNQRFHLLNPDDERYVNEIEKSIYNVGIPNQGGSKGIRYHANLVGRKDAVAASNTCCEGQGTRFYGALPEFIYSQSDDGIYVDLFAGSTFTFDHKDRPVTIHMETSFPYSPEVAIKVVAAPGSRWRMHIRVPAWAAGPMVVSVNGAQAATGKPGSYVVLDRPWRTGDTVRFTLPVAFRMTAYRGADQVAGQPRYALEYGPVLMAVVGKMDEQQGAHLPCKPAELVQRLKPEPGARLHFTIDGDSEHRYIPYWDVDSEVFTCYPIVDEGNGPWIPKVHTDNLAEGWRGATARSDSEYANEPGCTVKVIDGIIATADNFSNRWHSSLDTPHPHWIEVKLKEPARIGEIVVHFADPGGHPVSFQGLLGTGEAAKSVFDVKDCAAADFYRVKIRPTTADTFRLVIRSSANPAYPNAAQVSEIELLPAR